MHPFEALNNLYEKCLVVTGELNLQFSFSFFLFIGIKFKYRSLLPFKLIILLIELDSLIFIISFKILLIVYCWKDSKKFYLDRKTQVIEEEERHHTKLLNLYE